MGFLRRGRGRRKREEEGGWEGREGGREGEGGDWETGVECTIHESRIII